MIILIRTTSKGPGLRTESLIRWKVRRASFRDAAHMVKESYNTCFYCIASGLSGVARAEFITKTCLYNVDPLKLHFYIVKLGFTGVNIIFLISAQKHRLWVLVRTASPRRF